MTTAPNEHIDDLVDLYALGALEPAEQDRVDAHIRSCERCQAALSEATRVVAVLAWVPEQREPSAELRARVMARAQQGRTTISATAPARVAPAKFWWRQLIGPTESRAAPLVRRTFGAAALLLMLALLGNTVRLQEQLHQFQEQTAGQQQIITALRAPGARVVAFSGTDANSGHSQLLINTTGNQAYLLTDGLPVLPPDKTYELWLVRDQQPVRSNVFNVDREGIVTVQVLLPAQLRDYQAAAISVEPAGGSNTPSTKPFLLTKF